MVAGGVGAASGVRGSAGGSTGLRSDVRQENFGAAAGRIDLSFLPEFVLSKPDVDDSTLGSVIDNIAAGADNFEVNIVGESTNLASSVVVRRTNGIGDPIGVDIILSESIAANTQVEVRYNVFVATGVTLAQLAEVQRDSQLIPSSGSLALLAVSGIAAFRRRR